MVEYDAVIVGAGVLGLATAYHLKSRNPESNVLVIDKFGAAGQGSTAKSAAAFRCFFHSRTNFALSDSSVEFYKHIQNDLEFDLKLRWTGYLWLFDEDEYCKMLPVLKDLASKGLQYVEYEESDLVKKLDMRTDLTDDEEAQLMGLRNVRKGILIPKAGLIDVDSLVKFYESEFMKLRGKIQYNTEAMEVIVESRQPLGIPGEPFFWQDATVAGVKTNRGLVKAKKTIIVAGPWIAKLLDSIGVECFIKAKKRQVFSVKAKTEALKKLLFTKEFTDAGCLPFTIPPTPSAYIRPAPEEDALWLAYADDFPRAFKAEDNPEPEENFYKYGLYQVIVKYFPQFTGCQPFSAFAGLYEINTIDHQPLIFEENGIMVVGGASGSGIMKADAIGRIAAALYKDEEYALLYGDRKFKVSDLGLKDRNIEHEKLVI
ncbi:MAG: FAD-binding oxidoreductase [Candidatus Bathyarchaeota archaeon]|nr:FAD-binding oxidoreductase [Candidatus Bathyarchaeota archaeon]MDH5788226.1 FAD-binding oxidoreductase [Candidatus Bathyarchaeota archaeon]